MSRIIPGIFIILHGLVHIWYVVLSFNLVAFQPDMGWTGNSWLFSFPKSSKGLRVVAGILFIICTILFVVSGITILANLSDKNSLLLIAAILSTLTLVVFWDGKTSMIVQKGIIGVIINLVIIIGLLLIP